MNYDTFTDDELLERLFRIMREIDSKEKRQAASFDKYAEEDICILWRHVHAIKHEQEMRRNGK